MMCEGMMPELSTAFDHIILIHRVVDDLLWCAGTGLAWSSGNGHEDGFRNSVQSDSDIAKSTGLRTTDVPYYGQSETKETRRAM
jgi:hypothetical protein